MLDFWKKIKRGKMQWEMTETKGKKEIKEEK